jgi:hypothetical protein
MEDYIKRILQNKQFHLQLKSEQRVIIQNVLEKNPIATKCGNVPTQSWSIKSAVFLMESTLTSHGSSKSIKKPSDGRGISD